MKRYILLFFVVLFFVGYLPACTLINPPCGGDVIFNPPEGAPPEIGRFCDPTRPACGPSQSCQKWTDGKDYCFCPQGKKAIGYWTCEGDKETTTCPAGW